MIGKGRKMWANVENKDEGADFAETEAPQPGHRPLSYRHSLIGRNGEGDEGKQRTLADIFEGRSEENQKSEYKMLTYGKKQCNTGMFAEYMSPVNRFLFEVRGNIRYNQIICKVYCQKYTA